MAEVLRYDRDEPGSLIYLDVDGEARCLALIDGILETYIEVYWLPPEQALDLVVLDACDDTVEIPFVDSPGARAGIERLLSKAQDLVWRVDKAEVLRKVLVDRDTAPGLADRWRSNRLREEEVGAAYARRQEELAAEEMVSAMVDDKKSRPVLAGGIADVVSGRTRESTFRVEW